MAFTDPTRFLRITSPNSCPLPSKLSTSERYMRFSLAKGATIVAFSVLLFLEHHRLFRQGKATEAVMEMEKAREETRIMATVAAREATKTVGTATRPAEPGSSW